jgi:hypothetical protein
VQSLAGIGVDQMGALVAQKEVFSFAASSAGEQRERSRRMKNLDTDISPNLALEATVTAISSQKVNDHLPLTGLLGLRGSAAVHVSRMTCNGKVYKPLARAKVRVVLLHFYNRHNSQELPLPGF